MGNRAVICFDEYKPDNVGIYLHWNGGRDSVEAFLEAAKRLKVPLGDPAYALARLVQVIGNFFGGTTSVGVETLANLDCENGDNGVYVVDSSTFEIKERKFFDGDEQEGHDLDEMVEKVVEDNPQFTRDET